MPSYQRIDDSKKISFSKPQFSSRLTFISNSLLSPVVLMRAYRHSVGVCDSSFLSHIEEERALGCLPVGVKTIVKDLIFEASNFQHSDFFAENSSFFTFL